MFALDRFLVRMQVSADRQQTAFNIDHRFDKIPELSASRCNRNVSANSSAGRSSTLLICFRETLRNLSAMICSSRSKSLSAYIRYPPSVLLGFNKLNLS